MIARIGKTFSFDAAHHLPNHDGKCAREHGHTYAVTFEASGPIKEGLGMSDEGMVADFGIFNRVWTEALEPRLDHRNLNESIGEECWPTTAENIALWIFNTAADLYQAHGVKLVAVEVRETPKTFARIEA